MKGGNVAVFVPHAGCPHKCSFCDQRAISGSAAAPSPQEVDALLRRALERAQRPGEMEIAFFGGSFTAIDRGLMTALLEAAQPYLGPGAFGGVRISTRPDYIDDTVLRLLKRYGVTAIELGAQSMRDAVLNKNERGHTAKAVRDACALISREGFSLGLQMMTGLYGDDDAGALYTAEEFLKLRPDTVRIYPTVVLEGTVLAEYVRRGLYAPPDAQASVPLCAQLLKLFTRSGVRVIRLGLHASRQVEEQLVAGAYHPALRELCEGEWMLESALAQLRPQPPGHYLLRVHPRDVSRMTGQKRCNLLRLHALGYEARVLPDPAAAPFSVEARRACAPRDARLTTGADGPLQS